MSSKTATRRINIYLNGKAIKGSLKDVKKEWRQLNAEIGRTEFGTEEYTKKAKRIKELKSIMAQHRKNISGISNAWKKTNNRFNQFLGLAAAKISIDGLVQMGKAILSNGAFLEGLDNKLRTVFENSLPQVSAAAKENAKDIGLSTSAYEAQAVAIGDLIKPFGFTAQEAANLSIETLNLAGIASEYTKGIVSTKEATEIYRKAILGEREALERLGIKIDEELIKQKLQEQGLKNLSGAALRQAKVMATLELITEQTGDAQKAFAKNGDSILRSQAELEASIERIKDQVSRAFIPALSRLSAVASGVVGAFADFIAQPVSEKMEEERFQLNQLIPRITEAGISEEERGARIKELQTLYPDFLGNLNAETVTNEQLAERLGDVNNQYILKIALQREDEKIQRQAEVVAKVRLNLADREREANDKIVALNEKYNLGVDLTNKTLEERITLIREAVKTQGVEIDNVQHGRRVGKQSLGLSQELLNVLKQRAEIQDGELSNLRKVKEELKQNLLLQLGINEAELEKPTTDEGPTIEERLAAAERDAIAEKERKKREKEAEAAAKKAAALLERQQKKILEILARFQQDRREAQLSDDNKAAEQIRAKFQKEIDLAMELEAKGAEGATAQRLELERLRDEAIQTLRREQSLKAVNDTTEEQAKQDEIELLRLQEQENKKRDLRLQVAEVIRSEKDNELLALDIFYGNLLSQAELYEIDVTELKRKWEEERGKIIKKGKEEEQKTIDDANKKRLESQAALFTELGNVINNAFSAFASSEEEMLRFQKAGALAQIAFDTGSAISSIVAAAASTSITPIDLALKVAAGIGSIITSIGRAKKALSEGDIPSYQQKFTGGWTKARGATDGRIYNAQDIGSPGTRMLPNHPVLVNTSIGQVLGSERGAEYFVANQDVQKPAVLNHIRAIENITRGRSYPQYMEGGATAPLPQAANNQAATVAGNNEVQVRLLAAVNTLIQVLSNPITAQFGYDAVEQITEAQQDIQEVSGGA